MSIVSCTVCRGTGKGAITTSGVGSCTYCNGTGRVHTPDDPKWDAKNLYNPAMTAVERKHKRNPDILSIYEHPTVKKIEMNALVKHMVDRFLRWRLPENFSPDGGIRYVPYPPQLTDDPGLGPTGTNLFTAEQAEVMVRYMLFGGTDQ